MMTLVRRPTLNRLNPIAKIAAAAPAMVALVALRDPVRPALFLLLALLVIVFGAELSARKLLLVICGFPAAVFLTSVGFGLWTVAAVPGAVLFHIGPYSFSTGMWWGGLETGVRLTAIVALSCIAGLTMTGPDLVRALVQQGRLPYRLAWAGLAAIRFVPRLRVERDTIRAARRVRGIAPESGVLARLRERFGFVLPLMVSAIRHAERVGLAMDSRAFGAYPTRTERVQMRWTIGDTVCVAVAYAVTLVVLCAPVLHTLVWA